MKRCLLTVFFASIILLCMTACSGKQAETTQDKDKETDENIVVVYSSHEDGPLNAGVDMFMEKYPNIKVDVVTGGTGELCDKIADEADDPVADVMWGGGADSLEAFKEHFEPYVCANDKAIDPTYKEPNGLWTGESPLPMVIFYNKKLIEDNGLYIPQGWSDLIKPEWNGKIAYCQPSASGSAYTQLCTMLFAHGGIENGWDFIEQFYENLDGKILESSEKCHEMVASGDFYVGLTFEKAAVQYKDDPNLGFVYPNDGTSAVPDGVALIKNAPHEENAKLFIDFVTSKECQEEQSLDWGRRPVRSDVKIGEGLAPLSDIVTVKYDFEQAAGGKEAILKKFNDITSN